MDAVVVNATDEQGGAEGTGAAVLGEGLLEVADFLDEHVNGDRCSVGDAVDLCFNACSSHQLAGIGHQARRCDADVTVDLEHLLNGFGDDEAADDALVADQHHAVFELQRSGGCSTLHRFTGVLN